VCLDAGDAVELDELLEFIGDWLVADSNCLGDSLRRFVGVDAFDIDELRSDLLRFAFLLGVDDGELLFGGDER
jgi:hypothetical protein